jgi:hypothetical protein
MRVTTCSFLRSLLGLQGGGLKWWCGVGATGLRLWQNAVRSGPGIMGGGVRERQGGLGELLYGPQERVIEVDDRTLAHLKMVIVSKLRRDEAFVLSWPRPIREGSGRDSVWLSAAIPLQFHFVGNRPPSLNQAWLEALTESANRGELHVISEPGSTPTRSGSFPAEV